jgi:hypothetical protein
METPSGSGRSGRRRPRWRMRASPGDWTAASRRPTGFGPRAPTRCWPPRARRAFTGSSPRASPACGTRGLIEPIRKRQYPIVGGGGGVFSFHPPRRRRRSDRARARTRRSRHLQHRRRRARPSPRVAASARQRARRQAAPPRSPLARAAGRRRSRGHDGNRVPRRLEHQGQARARVDAALPKLAPRLSSGLRPADTAPGLGVARQDRTPAGVRSFREVIAVKVPAGCPPARSRPGWWCRRHCCVAPDPGHVERTATTITSGGKRKPAKGRSCSLRHPTRGS